MLLTLMHRTVVDVFRGIENVDSIYNVNCSVIEGL
jgi:hypothetical protein